MDRLGLPLGAAACRSRSSRCSRSSRADRAARCRAPCGRRRSRRRRAAESVRASVGDATQSSPYRPGARCSCATASGIRYRIGWPPRTRSRSSVEEISIPACRKNRAPCPPPQRTRARSRPSSRAVPGAPPPRASPARAPARAPASSGNPAATSPPTIRNSSLSGVSAVQLLKRIDRVRRPAPRAISRSETSKPLVALRSPAGTARAGARSRARPRRACAAESGRASASRDRARAEGTPPGRRPGDQDVAG